MTVGPVAHGGHCVARHDGRVIFVRHCLPGEQVVVEVGSLGGGGRYARADAVDVLSASPDRVPSPCALAGPGGCGGCDWQHAGLPAQRGLKAEVLREQLVRLGGTGPEDVAGIDVRPVAGDADGLAWRTRQRWSVGDDGRLGLHRHRSADVVAVQHCPLVTAGVDSTGVTGRAWPGREWVSVVASSTGDLLVTPQPGDGGPPPRAGDLQGLPGEVAVTGVRGRSWVSEEVAGRTWRVTGDGFWQVHPGAPGVLVATVRDLLRPAPGEHLLDLYAGVGLFAGALAAALGPGGRVDAVEADRRACADARRSMHDLPTVRIHHARVDRWLARQAPRRCDLVVLDPPRAGAGAEVLRRLIRLRPRAVAYVACDPAALGRDVGLLRAAGWALAEVRGLDCFPMTAHVEAVALLVPDH